MFIMLTVLHGTEFPQCSVAQDRSESVDWKEQLKKAQAQIAKEPASSFWHNQAGVAYDALGDFRSAERELRLASRLNPKNPIDDYALYALYMRRRMFAQGRDVLLNAIKKDSDNPIGHFLLGVVLEKNHNWSESLRQYRQAKLLASMVVQGYQYINLQGNSFEIDGVRAEVDKAIERVAKQIAADTGSKRE